MEPRPPLTLARPRLVPASSVRMAGSAASWRSIEVSWLRMPRRLTRISAMPALASSTRYHDIVAAIGPLIRQASYEVGAEFVDRFGPRLAHLNGLLQVLSQLSSTANPASTPNAP